MNRNTRYDKYYRTTRELYIWGQEKGKAELSTQLLQNYDHRTSIWYLHIISKPLKICITGLLNILISLNTLLLWHVRVPNIRKPQIVSYILWHIPRLKNSEKRFLNTNINTFSTMNAISIYPSQKGKTMTAWLLLSYIMKINECTD